MNMLDIRSLDIRQARRKLGLSVYDLAKLTNTSSGRTVRRWEAGTKPVPLHVIDLLLRLLAKGATHR